MPVYPLKTEEAGSVYYLWSTVSSPGKILAKIDQSGLLPTKVYLNNSLIGSGKEVVELKSGINPIFVKIQQHWPRILCIGR